MAEAKTKKSGGTVPVAVRLVGLNRLKVVRLAALSSTVFVQSKKNADTPCPIGLSLKRPPGGVPVGRSEGGEAEVSEKNWAKQFA